MSAAKTYGGQSAGLMLGGVKRPKKPTKAEAETSKLRARLGAARFGLLERLAATMDKAAWTGGDNTPLTVWRNFAWPLFRGVPPEPGRLARAIVETIDTGRAEGSKAERERQQELCEAFKGAGLWRAA